MTLARRAAFASALAFALALSAVAQAGRLTPPREALGFEIGDDYQLANYTQLAAWWQKLAAESDRMKLVDVYPNGYEALVLDEGLRLRYRDGFVPEHIQAGKVYPIKVDLWSTALVFNAGHKIAVHVSSSNSPRFEPHSNTWEPVKSYDEAVKATNTVVLDGRSKIVLPVTKVYAGEKSVALR